MLEVYTKEEVAEQFKVSLRTIDNLLSRKELQCFYVGKNVRINRTHIDTYITNHLSTHMPTATIVTSIPVMH